MIKMYLLQRTSTDWSEDWRVGKWFRPGTAPIPEPCRRGPGIASWGSSGLQPESTASFFSFFNPTTFLEQDLDFLDVVWLRLLSTSWLSWQPPTEWSSHSRRWLAIDAGELWVSYVQWREVLQKGWPISAPGKSDTQVLNKVNLQFRSWKYTEDMGVHIQAVEDPHIWYSW